MTRIMALVSCQKCDSEMTLIAGRIFYCPSCKKWVRLVAIRPIVEGVTYEQVQMEQAKEQMRFGEARQID